MIINLQRYKKNKYLCTSMRSFRYLLSIVLFFCCFQSLWSQQKYVIVSPSEFRETLHPFVEWKRQTGFLVKECYVDTNSPETIHQILQSHYDQATLLNPAPSYVLLVGDVDRLGTFAGRHQPNNSFEEIATDMYYVEFTGDSRPDAMLGRWSVANVSQLADVVEKTLRYERYQLLSHDYLRQSLVVAGRETSTVGVPVPILTNGQVNYVSRALREACEEMDTSCFYNPESENQLDTIVSLLREGRGVVYYTSHCIAEGWLHPSLDNDIIDTLSESFPAVYINNCCLSSRFVEDCFGEHLLRKAQGGAVGVIGASNETLWNEDYYWSLGAKFPFSRVPDYDANLLGMFDRWLHRYDEPKSIHAATLGQMLFAGNEAVAQFESPYGDYYWEIYNILGDPSLMPYVGEPESLLLSCDSDVVRGDASLSVSTLAGALVAVTQGDELLGVAVADSLGRAEVLFAHPATADSLCVTATLQNHIPLVVYLPVRRALCARLTVTDYSVEVRDSVTLRLVVTNVGGEPVIQHYVSVEDTLLQCDTLMPEASQSFLLRFPFVPDTIPLFGTMVRMIDAEECYASMQISADAPVDYPTLQSVVVRDSVENAVQILSANSNYNFRVGLSSYADSLKVVLTEFPSMRETRVTFSDTLRMGTLPFRLNDDTRRLKVTIASFLGRWHREYSYWMLTGSAVETFESGDFSRFPWDTSALRPWISTQSQAHEGDFSARSAVLSSRQTSRLSIPLFVLDDDTVSFWTRVSSEEGHDRLYFYIDDQLQGYWSGVSMWTKRSFPIEQGLHRLSWRYEKDDTRSENQDCIWIDDIHFPLALWDSLVDEWDTATSAIETPEPEELYVNIYPNPASGQCHVTLSDALKDASLTIYDISGRRVAAYRVAPSTLSLQPFRNGIYTLVFVNDNVITTKKLMVRNHSTN